MVKEISATREGLEALKGLTRLCLKSCHRMMCIPKGMLQQLTRDVATIFCSAHPYIMYCRELVQLLEEEDIKPLNNLHVIQLVSLPKMACLPQAIQHLSSLKSLLLNDLP